MAPPTNSVNSENQGLTVRNRIEASEMLKPTTR